MDKDENIVKRIYDQYSIDKLIENASTNFPNMINGDDFTDLGKHLNGIRYMSEHVDLISKAINQDVQLLNQYEELIFTIHFYNNSKEAEVKHLIDLIEQYFPNHIIKMYILNYENNNSVVNDILRELNANKIQVNIIYKAKLHYYEDLIFKEYLDSSNLILTDYIGTNKSIDIPKEVYGIKVDGFDWSLVRNNYILDHTIPKHIDNVFWNNAFYNSKVKSITFENNTYIPLLLFESSSHLERLILPQSLDVLPNKSIRNHKKLKYLKLPELIEEIDYSALEYLNNLRYLVLPKSLKIIKEGGLPRNLDKFSSLIIESTNLKISESLLKSLNGIDIYLDKDSTFSIYDDLNMEIKEVITTVEIVSSEYMVNNNVYLKLPQSIVEEDGITYLIFDDLTATVISIDEDIVPIDFKIPSKINNCLVNRTSDKVLKIKKQLI